MEKSHTLRLEPEDSDVCPAAASTELQKSSGTQEVMSGGQQNKQKRRSDGRHQRKQQEDASLAEQQPLLIHGLSVQRYREIHSSVLQPPVLATLSSAQQADYVSQVLELKQRLWTELSRPRLVETPREDGRVEVKEIFDLT